MKQANLWSLWNEMLCPISTQSRVILFDQFSLQFINISLQCSLTAPYLPCWNSLPEFLINHYDNGHHMSMWRLWCLIIRPQIILQVLAELQHHDTANCKTEIHALLKLPSSLPFITITNHNLYMHPYASFLAEVCFKVLTHSFKL